MRFFLLILILSSQNFALSSKETPSYMGAISCASSACHGNPSPLKGAPVLRNEFTVWSRQDPHSRAFKALLNEDGKRIASHLGITDPTSSPECLSCHATYVKDINIRTANFRIEDGISCETCHGAAEKYLKSHARAGTPHAKNIELGMTDLSSPLVRAEICLNCHQGDRHGSANHKLLGAGHPRISFELETFSATQPAHYRIDEDYLRRKGPYDPAKNWLLGQIAQGIKISQNLQNPNAQSEFSNLYCYSCHHQLDQKQFKTHEYQNKTGEPRLNTSTLQMIEIAFKVLNPKLANEFTSANDFSKKESVLIKAKDIFLKSTFTEKEKITLLKEILIYGSQKSPSHHYETAEQIAMAVSNLILSLNSKPNSYKTELEKIYKTLNNPSSFQPNNFSNACRELSRGIT